jgi:flagellar assembly protein FliH
MSDKPLFRQSEARATTAAAPLLLKNKVKHKEPELCEKWERWKMPATKGAASPIAEINDDQRLALALNAEEDSHKTLREQTEAKTQAHLLGYTSGETEGRLIGYAQGFASAVTKVTEQSERLRELCEALPEALHLAQTSIAQELSALALSIARQIVGKSLETNQQVIVDLVHDLLKSEPALSGTPQLILHPDDAELVKEHLAEDIQSAGWRIKTDSNTSRGGCRVLAVNAERDATLESRWTRIEFALNN